MLQFTIVILKRNNLRCHDSKSQQVVQFNLQLYSLSKLQPSTLSLFKKKQSKLLPTTLEHTKKSLSPSLSLHSPCLASESPPKAMPPLPKAWALDCNHSPVKKK